MEQFLAAQTQLLTNMANTSSTTSTIANKR
jgi:hypothetical protein